MGRIRKLLVPGVDKKLLVRDATKLMPDPTRRRFIAGGASLGALTLLTGCDVIDSSSAEEVLKRVSKFNDAVQDFIFNPDALAPTFPESAITKPFPFNAYYDLDDAPEIDADDWKLEVRGLVDNKKSWTLPELYKLPQVSQITRHICVEGWSAIGKWTGTPLREFLRRIGAEFVSPDRPQDAVAATRRLTAVLAAGRSLAVWPEGSLSPAPGVRRR